METKYDPVCNRYTITIDNLDVAMFGKPVEATAKVIAKSLASQELTRRLNRLVKTKLAKPNLWKRYR